MKVRDHKQNKRKEIMDWIEKCPLPVEVHELPVLLGINLKEVKKGE